MFQPTQQLLFRPLSSLGHFRIHQQLPLNPRESKQLLNLLTSSFRQQLDKEHGVFRPVTEGRAVVDQPKHVHSKVRRHSLSKPDTLRPTDRHLHAILTNPLFSYNAQPAAILPQTTRDPMDLFEEACAKGLMEIDYARACLKAKKELILQSPILDIREGLKTSGAGGKVLKWLVSSGMANDPAFHRDEAFSTILIEYLVAENLQEAVWTWIIKANQAAPSTTLSNKNSSNKVTAARLLLRLIKSEASGPASLDGAYKAFERASKTLSSTLNSSPLGPAGRFLSHESTVYASLHAPSTPTAFDSFLRLLQKVSDHFVLNSAHLMLHHPSRPSASIALACLREREKQRSSGEVKSFTKSTSEGRMIALGLDTAKFLFQRDEFADARWVMDFLQETYPEQLGMTRQKMIEQAKAEASSMELLEGLSLV